MYEYFLFTFMDDSLGIRCDYRGIVLFFWVISKSATNSVADFLFG